MLADAPQFLLDLGTVAGALTAILIFLGLLSRLRPIKWVWKQVVSEPFGEWLTRHIDEVVQPVKDELTPNGGGSVKDKIDDLHEGQSHMMTALTEHEQREMRKISSLNDRQNEIETDMTAMRAEQHTIHRLAVRIARWTHNFREFEPVKLHDLDLVAEQDEIDEDLLEADPPDPEDTDGET